MPTVSRQARPDPSRRPAGARCRAAITAGLLALSGLAGCGEGGDAGPAQAAGPSPTPTPTPTATPTGRVTVSGNRILRDGSPWVPHALQLVAFVAAPKARSGPFLAAYQHYTTAEFAAIKAWGADTVRMQLSQPGADPDKANTLYDPDFVAQYVAGVKAARAIGLNVIVSIQDEPQSGEPNGTAPLPNDATNRVWTNLAPLLNGDDGIIYEMLNEPQLDATPANWIAWANAMNVTIGKIRATGATNTVLADGLQVAERLGGVIPLTDPLNEVAYSTHPYFHQPSDETAATWDVKFGSTAQTLPVLVGEWATPVSFYCGPETPAAALAFLHYIADRNIGLVAANYDFGLPKFGGPTTDFSGTPTTYVNRGCGDDGYGPGTLIQDWYRTGTVPATLQ